VLRLIPRDGPCYPGKAFVVSREPRQMDNNEISYKILITEFVFIRFNPDLYDSTFTYSIQRINGPVSSEFLLKINKG